MLTIIIIRKEILTRKKKTITKINTDNATKTVYKSCFVFRDSNKHHPDTNTDIDTPTANRILKH